MKFEEEEREPGEEQRAFSDIQFGPPSSSSSSSSSSESSVSVSERECFLQTRKRESAMSSEGSKGTGGKAIPGGVREVYNPYTRRNAVFGSSRSNDVPTDVSERGGAQKKRRVQADVVPHHTVRDAAEEGGDDDYGNLEATVFDEILESASKVREEAGLPGMPEPTLTGGIVEQSQAEVSNVSEMTDNLIEPYHRPQDVEETPGFGDMYVDREEQIQASPLQQAPVTPVHRVPDGEEGDIDMIARSIMERKDGACFEAGERDIIDGLSSNSKKYVQRVDSVLKRMLRTAAERCGETIGNLARREFMHRNGVTVPLLLFKISGERHESKRIIINSVMVQVALSWRLERKTKDKVAGDFPESTTWDQWLKLLQSSFRNHDIRYSLKTDFFGKGQFHGVLERFYRMEKKKNPKFGTGQYASIIPEDIEEKMLEGIESGVLDLEDRHHLQMVCYYLVGARLCLRGGTECHDRVWSEFSFVKEKEGDGVHNYVSLIISETTTKGMQITVRCKCFVLFHFLY